MRLKFRSVVRAGDRSVARGAFTVIELLVVMAIILVLAGLVLATSSYVHNKGARSRAEAEIAAISAALENYKADNGVYPSNGDTNVLNATTDFDPAVKYKGTSLLLYQQLSGDTNNDRSPDIKSYFAFKDNQLSPQTGDVTSLKDPFGNSYGYSTKNAADVAAGTIPAGGFNPTFDLWSTAGGTKDTDKPGWIKNW